MLVSDDVRLEGDKHNDFAKRYSEEINDARLLLEFAISQGLPIDDQLIQNINNAGPGILERQKPNGFPTVGSESLTDFQKAYRDLAKSLIPVTASTLRATSDDHGRQVPLLAMRKVSEGKIWSRKMWLFAILTVVFILGGEILDHVLQRYFPVDEDTEGSFFVWQVGAYVTTLLIPFTYGALGALTYLLRVCHEFIHKREFDPLRIPEYYNRILLGIISGGTILLFVERVTTDNGTIALSGKALGFLAGYNTDFLFSALERVAAAILPKVGLDSIAKKPLSAADSEQLVVGIRALQPLLDRYQKSDKPDEKELIKGLIDKAQARL